jgi:F0F1-type ATP synthase membrane subunit b/b'
VENVVSLPPTTLALAEGGGNILTPDGSILVVFLIFIALVPILNRAVVKPITDVLAERERRTSGAHTDSLATTARIEHRLGEYEEGITSARGEGYQLLESRRALAMSERQTAVEAARAAAQRTIDEAKARVGAEAEAAKGRLAADARDIAREITATVLGRAAGGSR